MSITIPQHQKHFDAIDEIIKEYEGSEIQLFRIGYGKIKNFKGNANQRINPDNMVASRLYVLYKNSRSNNYLLSLVVLPIGWDNTPQNKTAVYVQKPGYTDMVGETTGIFPNILFYIFHNTWITIDITFAHDMITYIYTKYCDLNIVVRYPVYKQKELANSTKEFDLVVDTTVLDVNVVNEVLEEKINFQKCIYDKSSSVIATAIKIYGFEYHKYAVPNAKNTYVVQFLEHTYFGNIAQSYTFYTTLGPIIIKFSYENLNAEFGISIKERYVVYKRFTREQFEKIKDGATKKYTWGTITKNGYNLVLSSTELCGADIPNNVKYCIKYTHIKSITIPQSLKYNPEKIVHSMTLRSHTNKKVIYEIDDEQRVSTIFVNPSL